MSKAKVYSSVETEYNNKYLFIGFLAWGALYRKSNCKLYNCQDIPSLAWEVLTC